METRCLLEPATTALEQCRISPAPGSMSPESLPLTFFDCISLLFDPMQRVFFYDLPCSVPEFLADHLPQLKVSLSVAIRDFRPLAGCLYLGSDGAKHEIRCSDLDAVPLVVAKSDDDFYDLSGNHARDCARFHPLVPPLPPRIGAGLPLLALQLTLFPDAGVALGTTISHAVADGTTAAQFLKYWAAAYRLEKAGIPAGNTAVPPSYERSIIQDAGGLERIYRRDIKLLKDARKMSKLNVRDKKDMVRSTFLFDRDQINKLGEELRSKTGIEGSAFALVSGFIWASLVKAQGSSPGKAECFGFAFEARRRLEPPLPANYFGNCVGLCRAEAEGSQLLGEDGAAIASSAIWKAIQILKSGALKGAEHWIKKFSLASARLFSVAGSPRLGMYQVDFGWGRPRKNELIFIESLSAMSVAEWGEDGRGIEVGLALSRDLMERFSTIVADRLS